MKRKLFHHFLKLFFACMFTLQVLGQSNKLKFESVDNISEVPNYNALCFLHDRQNLLWIGTNIGLIRYDGYNSTIFNHDKKDTLSISNNNVHQIVEDENGNLWIATERGLNYFDKSIEVFMRFPEKEGINNALSNYHIRTLHLANQILWVGTYGGGLIKLNTENRITKSYQASDKITNSLAGNKINAFLADDKGNFWIGTENKGMSYFNPFTEQFNNYYPNDKPGISINDSIINDFLIDKQNNLWIATWNGGVNKLDLTSGKFTYYKQSSNNKNSLSFNTVRSIEEDNQGNLWFGTFGHGLNKFNTTENNFEHYYANMGVFGSITSDYIWNLYTDKSGLLWIGTINGGMNKLDPEINFYKHYSANTDKDNWLENNYISALCEDDKGILWIGTQDGGLYSFNRNTEIFTPYLNKIFGSSRYIRNLFVDKDKNLWVCTDYGIFIKTPNSNEFKYFTANTNVKTAYSILEDSQNRIWIGTYFDGLKEVTKIDHQKATINCRTHAVNTKSNETEPKSVIWSIYEFNDSLLWIGTNEGLYSFNSVNNRFNKIHDANVVKIIQVSPTLIAIGSLNKGLIIYNTSSKEWKTIQNSYSDGTNQVIGLEKDINNHLWVSTLSGLVHYNTETFEPRIMWLKQGFSNNIFTINAHTTLQSGEIVFGGNLGFSIFHPGEVPLEKKISPVLLTNLYINNKYIPVSPNSPERKILSKKLSETSKLLLKHNENTIKIEFLAPQFSFSERTKYAYMLIGIDTTWNYTNSFNGEATYLNLHPGEYEFLTKAMNFQGIWNIQPTRLAIEIAPPFWKRAWFICLSIIISLLGIWIISFFIKLKHRRTLNKIMAEQVRKHKMEQLAKEKELIQIKNKKLESEINLTALNIINKNSNLIEIRERLNYLAPFIDSVGKGKLESIDEYIVQILNGNDDWIKFEQRFNLAHNNYLERLKSEYPELTSTDLRFCAYIKLEFSNLEISNLLNLSLRGVETARSRIRKRLKLHRKQQLIHFLQDL
jgi:ligand-binding sensor domain-containing protein/DNA-binding CsgD family transcriptional regulator